VALCKDPHLTAASVALVALTKAKGQKVPNVGRLGGVRWLGLGAMNDPDYVATTIERAIQNLSKRRQSLSLTSK